MDGNSPLKDSAWTALSSSPLDLAPSFRLIVVEKFNQAIICKAAQNNHRILTIIRAKSPRNLNVT
jgi:hypothetical protein